jgi:mitochondrial fission 1 protein
LGRVFPMSILSVQRKRKFHLHPSPLVTLHVLVLRLPSLSLFPLLHTPKLTRSFQDVSEVETPLKAPEFQVLKSQYQKEIESGYISTQTKFNYSWALIKSENRGDQVEGLKLLTGISRILCFLLRKPIYPNGLRKMRGVRGASKDVIDLGVEIYKQSPERRRECLYYLALGNYKLGRYADAKRFNDLLLEKEGNNFQAKSLRALIEDKVAKGWDPFRFSWGFGVDEGVEGYIGMAIVASALAGLVAAGIMWTKRK